MANLLSFGRKLYEKITPQDEEAIRRSQASLAVANQRIQALGNSSRGVLAAPQARQQFIQQNQAPRLNLRQAALESFNTAASDPKLYRDAVVGTGRVFARIPETASRSLIEATGGQPQSIKVNDPIRRFLYGSEPLQTYQPRGEGINKKTGIPAPLAALGLAAMDLVPGGKGRVPKVGKATKGIEALPPSRQLAAPKPPAFAAPPLKDRGAKFTKPALSTTGYLDRFGPEGQQLSKLVNSDYEISRDFATKWYSKMPTVASLRGKDKKDFGLVVEGLASPRSAKVAKAVSEWRRLSPRIRHDYIRTSGEDIGDITNYYPRIIKRDYLKPNSTGYNAAVKHLVDSGQVKTPGEAIAALDFLRKSNVKGDVLGSFKFSREFNLPKEMYDTSTDALAHYLQGAADSVAKSKVFGMDKAGNLPVADNLIAQIAARGGDAQQVKKTLEQALGRVQYGENLTNVSNVVRGINVATKLGLGAITNSAQTVNTIIKNGYIDTLKGLGYLTTKEGRAYARDTGAFTQKLLADLRESSGYVTKGAKIGAPGFNSVEKFNRHLAASAGKFHAERLAKRRGKTLTKEQLSKAGRESSDKTQFIVAPHTLPGWASTPVGKMVAQFQTFSYKQAGFVNNEILKPLSKGDAMPFVRLLSLLPVGYGLYNLKDTLRLKDTDRDTAADKVIKAWRSAGGGGTPLDIGLNVKDAFEFSNSPSEFALSAITRNLGPTVGTGTEALKAGFSATQGRYEPAAKLGIRQLPVVGPTIVNAKFGNAGAGTIREFDPDKLNSESTPEEKKAAAKTEKAQLEKTAGQSYSLQQLANGKYAFTLEGDSSVHEYADLKDAQKAIAKDRFEKSGQNIKQIGDTVWRRGSDGKATSTPKIKYDESLGWNKLQAAKKADNLKEWFNQAEIQYANLTKQLEDPTLDELEISAIQEKITNLEDQAGKYKGYGGFTKPKTGRSGGSVSTAGFKTAGDGKLPSPKGISVRKLAAPNFKSSGAKKLSVSKIPVVYKSKKVA